MSVGGYPEYYDSAYIAASRGDNDLLERMVRRGLDVNATTSTDPAFPVPTLLHEAVRHGCNRTVVFLREQGADVDAEDSEGNTPLILALSSEKGKRTANALLCEMGGKRANVNCKNVLGYTPLFLAARDGDRPMVKLLITLGASPSEKTHLKETPRSVATDFAIQNMLGFVTNEEEKK